jgi:hypothetical protein
MTMTTEHTPQPWTEEETMAFNEALATFRDSLPPRQREAFNAILQTAAAAAADDDTAGYFMGRPLVLAPGLAQHLVQQQNAEQINRENYYRRYGYPSQSNQTVH